MKGKFLNYIKLTRLNHPTGIWLLFLPCLFGIFLALKKIENIDFPKIFWVIFLFFVGSVVMRSAGCIINDLFDRKFDEKVERTKNRPLASGKVKRFEAFILLGFLLALGFLILLQFNYITVFSGFVALTLVLIYPAMKRITYYPQIFLGLTFNFGILMSSLAILDEINLATIFLYCAAIFWTIVYDTIYAFQDIEDDMYVGVKSTAIKFRKQPKKILILLSLMMFLSLIYVGFESQFRVEFFLLTLINAIFLNQKIKKCDLSNPQNCLKTFKANIWVGVFVALSILIG